MSWARVQIGLSQDRQPDAREQRAPAQRDVPGRGLSKTGDTRRKSGNLTIRNRGRGLAWLRGRECTYDRTRTALGSGRRHCRTSRGLGRRIDRPRRDDRYQRGRDELDQEQQPEPVRQRRASGETVDSQDDRRQDGDDHRVAQGCLREEVHGRLPNGSPHPGDWSRSSPGVTSLSSSRRNS